MGRCLKCGSPMPDGMGSICEYCRTVADRKKRDDELLMDQGKKIEEERFADLEKRVTQLRIYWLRRIKSMCAPFAVRMGLIELNQVLKELMPFPMAYSRTGSPFILYGRT